MLFCLGNGMDKNKFEMLKESLELLVPQSLVLKMESGKIKEAGKLIWDFYYKDKTLPWEKQTKNYLMVSELSYIVIFNRIKLYESSLQFYFLVPLYNLCFIRDLDSTKVSTVHIT